MPAASPVASILIVAYQSGPDLGRCLEALDRQTRRDFEVILVDNASTDGAVEAIPHYDWLTLVRAPENVGFAAGNNLAARSARGRYLVALNPDAFAEPGWLDALIAAAERHPDAASVASVQLSHEDPDRLDGMGDPYAPWGAAWRGGKGGLAVPVAESEVFGPCAAAALYRRDAFEAVGGFCERFFCYYEDVDLALRLRRAGWRSVITPWAIVRHVGSGSTSSDFVLRHATRNRVWTYLRGMPALAGLVFAPVMAGLALAGVLAGVLRGGAGARARALLEAVRAFPETMRERSAVSQTAEARALGAMTWSPLRFLRRGVDARPIADLPDRLPRDDWDSPAVVAVIVSHEPDTRLDDVLDAALAQCARVVLVDNASSEEVRRHLRARANAASTLTLIENAENRGLAGAQNQGLEIARSAGADWILLLDDDSVPAPDMVARLLAGWRSMADRKRVGLLSPRLSDAEGTLKPYLLSSGTGWDLRRGRMVPGAVVRDGVFAIASGSLIRRDVLDVVGPMAGPFFIDYVDIEFSLRLRRAGFEIVGIGDAVLTHRLGEFHETEVLGRKVALNTHSAWRRRLIHRNRVRVWRRFVAEAPAWVAWDVAAALYDVWKAVVYETDKAAKLRAIFGGFMEGWRG
ncbi:glycosyltransferase [Thalassobaculum litoreum]|uniref:Glycosyltransferase, GT2 family n=1 Tax=Thalassobaculum litoreum DSM 18839 TaxID=1123362 RepID=A0A8G2BJA6_9PROT|nr:glycosyltransferase [Thalassobaculum litoreum]SDF94361.1 Glycosyltransferase, GT2 family [Thalassobaculum litoreum DSM 18839]